MKYKPSGDKGFKAVSEQKKPRGATAPAGIDMAVTPSQDIRKTRGSIPGKLMHFPSPGNDLAAFRATYQALVGSGGFTKGGAKPATPAADLPVREFGARLFRNVMDADKRDKDFGVTYTKGSREGFGPRAATTRLNG